MTYKLTQKSDLRMRSFNFSLDIIRLISNFPNNHIHWIFSDQLLRSATSIGANIHEAKSSSSRKDFIKFYDIALKSANETEYWLLLLKDSNLIKEGKLSSLISDVQEISRMLGSSLITLKGRRN